MELGYQTIDDFLNKRLPEREMEAIERHLKNNPLDAEMVANVADALQQGKSPKELKRINRVFNQSLAIDSGRGRKRNTARLSRVAAVVLVLGVPLVWLTLNQGSSPQELYAQHYAPYPDMITIRGEQEQMEALRLYNEGRYAEAMASFEKVMSEEPNNPTFRLYHAICLLETGKPALAIEGLKQLTENPDRALQELGHWYLTLAYLSSDQTEKAKTHLMRLQDFSSYYAEKAQAISSEL